MLLFHILKRKTVSVVKRSNYCLMRLTHKKTKSKRQELSALRFQEVYTKEYGDQWPSMYQGLKQKHQRCAVLNKYAAEQNETRNLLNDLGAVRIEINFTCGSSSQASVEFYHIPQGYTFPPPRNTTNGCLSYYLLDAASILPVLALEVDPCSIVLDMCAAPGGKTILAAQLLSRDGVLVSNELVYSRRSKLFKITNQYIDSSSLPGFQLSSVYGEKIGSIQPSKYDRVLVDVPCSGDRYSLQNGFSFQSWSEKKSKQNAKLQAKLLLSAVDSVCPGGHIVYSTCTMTPLENDLVVSYVMNVLDKHSRALTENNPAQKLVVNKPELSYVFADNFNILTTKFGYLVFPSLSKNWGPIYFCRLTKVQ